MEQQELNFCNYPGCQEQSNSTFHDDVHGGNYCSLHFFRCHGCGSGHGKQELTQLKTSKYAESYRNYCKSCFTSQDMQCPNCLSIINKEEFLPQKENVYGGLKKGGCTKCASKCESCEKVIDQDGRQCKDDNCYCEDCFSELYFYCDECNDYVDQDDAVYIENHDTGMCSTCYSRNYKECYECDTVHEKNDLEKYNDEYYCEKCIKNVKAGEFNIYSEKLPSFTYTPKDKFLNQLQKLLPISVKKFKLQHPSLAAGLNDLVSFSKGKDLTDDMVYNYRVFLEPESFPVKYQTWNGMQRSVDLSSDYRPEKDQLVLIIEAGKNTKAQLDPIKNGPLVWLFESVNTLSERSGHPSTPEQIGWARLELDPAGEYILVDEIQSDHLNAAHSLKNDNSDEIEKIKRTIQANFNLTEDQFKNVLAEYYTLLKDFPQIANQAITKFAQENGFKKIFWHTYESGKALKNNEPPKSLYTKLPKEHFYQETENRPFNLPGKFFEREARVNYLKRLTKDSNNESKKRCLADN